MRARNMPTSSQSKGIHPGGWLVALAGCAALLGACGVASSSSRPAAPGTSTLTAVRTMDVYAFDINPSADELIPAPGTSAGVISEGDESVINDQLTSTHLAGHGASAGYPIIGYDSGTCTFTRAAPDGQPSNSAFDTTLESCVATAFLPNGSITVQGVITVQSGTPQPATLAVTGGTGTFNGASGTLRVTFGSRFQGHQYKTLTITLQ